MTGCGAYSSSRFCCIRRAVLAKYYIGDLAVEDEQQRESLCLEDELADGTFYAVLKQRVSAYFRANKVGLGRRLACHQIAPFIESPAALW